MENSDLTQQVMDQVGRITMQLTELAVSSEQRMGTTNAMVEKMSEHCYHLTNVFNENVAALRRERDTLSETNKKLTEHNARLMEIIEHLQSDIRRRDDLIHSVIIERCRTRDTNISFGDVAGHKQD